MQPKIKLLSVTFDGMLNFGENVRSTQEKLQMRNNTVIKIAGSDRGCTKNTISVAYKAISWNVLDYGAPILGFHNQQYKLEPHANATKHCTNTGCVKMSDIYELHNEGEMLHVQAQRELLEE